MFEGKVLGKDMVLATVVLGCHNCLITRRNRRLAHNDYHASKYINLQEMQIRLK